MSEDVGNATVSYLVKFLNVLNEKLEWQGRALRGIYSSFEAQSKAGQKKKNEEAEGYYGSIYPLVQNVNLYNEKIHGQPARSDVTSVGIAMRLAGIEILVPVLTVTGVSLG